MIDEKRKKERNKQKKNHVLTLYFSHGSSCFISYNIYRFCIIFQSLYGNFTVIVQQVGKTEAQTSMIEGGGVSKKCRRENSRLLDPPNLSLTPQN